MAFYDKLYRSFGPQEWWPADGKFEVVIGAILTQNTSWGNVQKAIVNLKEASLLEPDALYSLGERRLAEYIRPSGYFNVKARRLKAFLRCLFDEYDGSLDKMLSDESEMLRSRLLSVNGIGFETADSILLYAAGAPVFVVDAYTRRILTRHHLINCDCTYSEIQSLFMCNITHDTGIFNEYHALIVKTGKDLCKKRNPLCMTCPLM